MKFGPLYTTRESRPKYAQVFVFDSDDIPGGSENSTPSIRLENINLRSNIRVNERNYLLDLLKELEINLKICNPFVKYLIMIKELHIEECYYFSFHQDAVPRVEHV